MNELEDKRSDKKKIEELESKLDRLRDIALRVSIVVQSKLTRRQHKEWNKWIEGVDLSPVAKLKDTFAFPKVGLQAMDKGAWVRLTGTAQPKGLTKEEGADICEYLNSFPENQHHLKNMDSEFKEMPSLEEIAKSVEKL